MAATDSFPAEEYGTSIHGTFPEGDRATLTPDDKVFLESPPHYEERPSLLATAPPPALATPSRQRRLGARALFVAIAGGSCLVLGLAILQLLGK